MLKRGLSHALTIMLIAGTFFGFGWTQPESAHAATGDIVAAGSITAGDIIYYGNYPQTDLGKVGTAPVPSGTVGTDYVTADYKAYNQSSDGNHYFKIEPIAWRVLENAAGKLFLLSEKAIDCKPYNINNTSITWETCTARSWLNGYAKSENTDAIGFNYAGYNFITNAFSAAEQGKIEITDVDNPVNFDHPGIPTGPSTTDKIFYLKIDDVTNASYGFTNDYSRIAAATGYTIAMGALVDSGNGYWWLRSPGSYAYIAAYVAATGVLYTGGSTVSVAIAMARPAFYLETSGLIFRETGTPNEYQASIPSTDATLSDLSVNVGELSPEFASGTEEYSVSVPNATNSITLTATKSDANALVTADGVKSLNVGENTFTITVTAEDGNTQKTYTVTVTRAASTDATLSNLSVSTGTLSPVFSSSTEEYTVSVPNATDSITLTATTTDTNATVTGDGTKSLNVGENKFEITVTAQDGITKKTYIVTVTRAAPDKTANDDEDEDEDDSDDDVGDEDFDTEDDDDDSDAVSDDENNDSDSGITSQPKTGDASMLVWLAAMLMSAAVLMLFVLIRIRRKARME